MKTANSSSRDTVHGVSLSVRNPSIDSSTAIVDNRPLPAGTRRRCIGHRNGYAMQREHLVECGGGVKSSISKIPRYHCFHGPSRVAASGFLYLSRLTSGQAPV